MKRINFKRIYSYVTHDVWRETTSDISTGRGFLVGTLKTIILSVRGFNDNDINMRANSLTYSMMFAVVPILALIIAIARGFGFESVIEDSLRESFLQEYGIVDTIMGFVQRYLETAQGGAFIGVGLFILLWAVYSFFRNVESSFNKIWEVSLNRNYARQFANYITVLILVPILIVASSGISILINSKEAEIGLEHLIHLNQSLIQFIPWATSWLIFILMYKVIPNTHVRWSSTIFPGILIGTLVQALQTGSVYIIVFLSRTSVVYGTFAAVPLLLTWVQWTCLLILLGAEMSYAIQNKESFNFMEDQQQMSRRYKDYLTLYICYQIIGRFERAERPYSARELADEDHVPLRMVNQLISRLIAVGMVSALASENEKEELRFQPARDISQITIGLLFEQIDSQGKEAFLDEYLTQPMRQFWSRWTTIKQNPAAYASLPIRDIMLEEIATPTAPETSPADAK